MDFSNEASATCKWARQSVEVLPERTSRLLKSAAEHLRGLEVPEAQRAAGTLVAELGHLSRRPVSSSELDANNPDPARRRRLRAAVQDDQVEDRRHGEDARGQRLRRDHRRPAARPRHVSASKRLSRATYRTRLRDGLGDLSQRTYRVQTTVR